MTGVIVWTLDENGKAQQMTSGTLIVNGVEYPCVNGEFHLIETPFTRMIAERERELVERYRRGEFED